MKKSIKPKIAPAKKVSKVRRATNNKNKGSTKDLVTVSGTLNIHGNPIELSVSLKSEDLEHLDFYCADDFEGFANDFREKIVWAAFAQIEAGNEKKLRGRHKNQQWFVTQLKVRAGWLYAFFKFWSTKPLNVWPEYLRYLLKKAKQEGFTVQQGKKYEQFELTRYCIETAYGRLCEAYGVNIEGPDNFYLTYIHDNKRPTTITKIYLRGRQTEVVASLGRTNPILRRVFSDLKIY